MKSLITRGLPGSGKSTALRTLEDLKFYYLTITIGCARGLHRSVYMVDRIANLFQQQCENVLIRHREIS